MKRLFYVVAALAVILAPVLPVRAEENPESHIVIFNRSDAWVWITAYDALDKAEHNAGAWCVGPNSNDQHGLATPVIAVRAEVTSRDCRHPVRADLRRPFPHNGNRMTNTYRLTELRGRYFFERSI